MTFCTPYGLQALNTAMQRLSSLRVRAAIALALAGPALHASAETPILGYVLEIEGTWFLKSNERITRLSKWDDVPAGQELRVSTPGEFDRIMIIDRNGKLLLERRCSLLGQCDKPVALPQFARELPLPSILDDAVKLLKKDPGIPSRHISRGSDAFDDAVVMLDKGQIDLSPVFRNTANKEYLLRVHPIRKGQRMGAGHVLEHIRIHSSSSWRAEAKNLQPGLYSLEIRERNGSEAEALTDPVWILVLGSEGFSRAASSFEQAKTLVRQWGAEVNEDTAQTVLRAHLISLSR